MPNISYITALHVVDQHEGTTRVVDLLIALAREHQGNRPKMAQALGVSTVTLWRYIKYYKAAHGEISVQHLFTKESTDA